MVDAPRLTWRRILRDGVLLYLVIGGVRLFVADIFYVPSDSMRPTLIGGDVVLLNQLAYAVREPKHGDVVIFRHPDNAYFIMTKRVVGVAGDSVNATIPGLLHLNGVSVSRRPIDGAAGRWQECLGPHTCYTIEDAELSLDSVVGRSVIVGGRHLYVLGDNRSASIDSRQGWQVPVANVLGRVERVAWSINPADLGLLAWFGQWRWSRTGAVVR